MRYTITLLLLLLFAVPASMLAQPKREPWTKTISVKDRRKNNDQPTVVDVTLSAWWMTSRVSPGAPIMRGPDGNPETIMFSQQPDGYIKFKIESIKWRTESGFDESPEYKVVVRSLWVDMTPRIFDEKRPELAAQPPAARRKMFITAPNVEYVHGDSMPPPIIFRIDRNNNYTFTIGFKTITPETDKEKPYPFTFGFTVDGLLRDGKGFRNEPVIEEPVIKEPVVVKPVDTVKREEVVNTDEIDAAVARAIEEEDVELLKELMADHPKVPSVQNARSYLALAMRRELIDSMTYQVDIYYSKFSRAKPTDKELSLAFRIGNRNLEGAQAPFYTWKDGKLFVSPPRDSLDYVLTATHRFTTENKASIVLNSVNDFINFTYADTLESESVTFHIKGGKGPYFLHIQRRTGDDYFDIEGAIKIYGDTVFTKDKLARAFALGEAGEFRFFVEDAEQLKKTGYGLVTIVPPPPIPPVVWYVAGGLLVAFLIGYLIWRRERRRRDEEMEKLLAARGGKDPRVKRKPKPDLKEFWKETAISDLSLHKNFIREVSTYLKERPRHAKGVPMIEGVILGTVLKFDFENEQYEVRLDRFRAVDPMPLNFYDDKPGQERWLGIREVTQDHRDLVKIGWLQVIDGGNMGLSQPEIQFHDEQFSELFQLMLKIDIEGEEKLCGFFTRTISGKVNNARDRKEGVDYWLDWDKLEDAGYYENKNKAVRTEGGETPATVRVNAGSRPA